MHTLLFSLVMVVLSLTPAIIPGPSAPVDWRGQFPASQPDDCTTDPSICDDHNFCTTDACLGGNCAHAALPPGTACSDGDACTSNDVCNSLGTCIGVSVVCDDGHLCTVDTCNATTGACTFTYDESLLVAPSVVISTGGGDIKVAWSSTGAESYEVHRSIDPYFVPAVGNLVETVTGAPPFVFYDPGVAADTDSNYDYQIVAMCAGNGKASTTVGEHGFQLVKGQ
jgi:hypothetical protein